MQQEKVMECYFFIIFKCWSNQNDSYVIIYLLLN